jgi:hypothetical protein
VFNMALLRGSARAGTGDAIDFISPQAHALAQKKCSGALDKF